MTTAQNLDGAVSRQWVWAAKQILMISRMVRGLETSLQSGCAGYIQTSLGGWLGERRK